MAQGTKSSTRNAKRKRGSSSNVGLWLIGGSVLILALVVTLIILNQRSVVAPVAQPDLPAEWINRDVMGSPDAKVVVQGWEDFLCPSCQSWTGTIKPQLVNDYIKTGKVRFEYHQFPLQQHAPGAQMAAQASLCAADAGKFWPMHDRLFQMAATRGQPGVTYDAVVQYAIELGIDRDSFMSCISSSAYQDEIVQSLNMAAQLGLNSTPSIIINGKLMPDPGNYNSIKAEIDAALAAQ